MLGTASTDQTTLQVEAGAIYAIANTTISADGNASIVNAGLFEKIGAFGIGTVAPALNNTGTVWVGAGTLDFLGGLTNSDSVIADTGSTLFLNSGISGAGITKIGHNALVQVTGTAAADQTIDFTTPGFIKNLGRLDLASPGSFAATIAGFMNGDTIDLLATQVTGIVYQGQSLTVDNNGSTVAVLHFAGSYVQNDFTTTSDGHSGTLILHT
jgi:hypothetical protein